MTHSHLLADLDTLPAAQVRARLVEAKKAVADLLATDLAPEIRGTLAGGMAAIDAGLAQAAVTALRDSVEILRRADAQRTVAAALKPRPPVNPAARTLVRNPANAAPAAAPDAGPAVADPAVAPAPIAPPRLLRPLPVRPPAAPPVQAPVVQRGGLAGLRRAATPVEEPEAEVVREEPAPRPVPQAHAAPIKLNGVVIGTPDDLKKYGPGARPNIRSDGTVDYENAAWDAGDEDIPF